MYIQILNIIIAIVIRYLASLYVLITDSLLQIRKILNDHAGGRLIIQYHNLYHFSSINIAVLGLNSIKGLNSCI